MLAPTRPGRVTERVPGPATWSQPPTTASTVRMPTTHVIVHGLAVAVSVPTVLVLLDERRGLAVEDDEEEAKA